MEAAENALNCQKIVMIYKCHHAAIQNQDKDGNLANIPQMEGKKTQKRSYSRCVTVTNEKSFFDCIVFVLKDSVVDHA